MSESMYSNLNCTNYEPLENKIEIFKEINSIPLKSIQKEGYLRRWFRDHKSSGRIYDLNSFKVAVFVKKAIQYFKKHNIKYYNDIFYYQKLDGQHYLSTAFQIIDKCLVYDNPPKYNLTKKELTGDCYHNIMLTYGSVLGTKKWKEKCERVQGEKNPGYQHGGKLSPFSENFVGYENDNVDYSIEDVIDKANKTRKENPERQPTRIEYWLAQGYDKYEAEEKLSEYQRKFSLDICIEKYGEEEGYRIWKDRQDRWLESYYDKTEEELKEINKKKGDHLSGGTNYSKIINNKNLINEKGMVYWVRLYNENEEYWKIGVSKNDLNIRFGAPKIFENKFGLKYELLDYYEDSWLNCLIIEQEILKDNRSKRVKLDFNGFTTKEAFSEPVINSIKENIDKEMVLNKRNEFLEKHNLLKENNV